MLPSQSRCSLFDDARGIACEALRPSGRRPTPTSRQVDECVVAVRSGVPVGLVVPGQSRLVSSFFFLLSFSFLSPFFLLSFSFLLLALRPTFLVCQYFALVGFQCFGSRSHPSVGPPTASRSLQSLAG